MFESILGVFLIPGIVWVFIITINIAFIYSVVNDTYGMSVVLTIVGLIIYWSKIVVVLTNWKLLLLAIGVYLLVGGGWSIFRWIKYCKQFIIDNPIESIHDYVKKDWSDFTHELQKYYEETLETSNHKSQIMGWIMFWPWSMIWNLVGDLVTFVFDMLQKTYKSITKNVIEKALKKGV